jgi:hypothetical protein
MVHEISDFVYTLSMHILLFLIAALCVFGDPHPIQFSIPECKIVQKIPTKNRDFAFIIPGDRSTYIYDTEAAYYDGYRRSFFAVTKLKGGWDCMRHYEILANGCIPYFLDLENCPPNIMPLFPKQLVLEAMNLPGVSYLHIDRSVFDEKRYYEILQELLDYTRKILTTRNIAKYLLDTIGYEGEGSILYLSKDLFPDYLRCCTLIGLKELLGERVVDVPKIEHIYNNYPGDDAGLWGRGFSYARVLDDPPIYRENIDQRILNREFDLIIYGSVHRGLLYLDEVLATYPPEKIVYLCGEDTHDCPYFHYPNLFLRECR